MEPCDAMKKGTGCTGGNSGVRTTNVKAASKYADWVKNDNYFARNDKNGKKNQWSSKFRIRVTNYMRTIDACQQKTDALFKAFKKVNLAPWRNPTSHQLGCT